MKAILEFDLSNYEDKYQHRRAVNATEAYLAIYEILELLRRCVRYEQGIKEGDTIALPSGEHVIDETQACILHQAIDNIKRQVHNIVNYRVNMDDLE